jgi:lipopolysaccharide/colanic/teichoic acid biosynthesis glycosyltransferase
MSEIVRTADRRKEHNGEAKASTSSLQTVVTSIPPNKISQSSSVWANLLHAVALPLIAGVSILGLEGQFTVQVFREAWPMMAVLSAAYVGAWILSSEFERFPFINQFEGALVSVSSTLVPVGIGFYVLPATPTRNLALLTTAGCVVWYLLDKLLRRYRASRLLLLPGETTRRLRSSPAVSEATGATGHLDGVVTDFHSSINGAKDLLARQAMKGIPVFHAGFVYEMLTGRVLLSASCDRSVSASEGRTYPGVKRAIDIVLIVVSLPITIPVMIGTAVAIYLESPGPVLFWQERIGKKGERFQVAKFRSMYLGNKGEDQAKYAREGDDRITRVGKVIRKLRIDELPQFWNILKGEMSLIGPRPEQVSFAHAFQQDISLYAERHSVKPGISGWAQVRQGYAAGKKENRRKLEYDLYYIKHRSLTLDLLIIYLTLKTILTGFGAR